MTRILPVAGFCSFVFLASLAPSVPALAQAQNDTAASSKADREELKNQWSLLKQQLGKLHDKIESDSKAINGLTDAEATKKRVAELQSVLSEALAETDDNGAIAVLAKKVLETDRAWLADVKTHNFTPEREAFLTDKFNTIIHNTEQTISGINAIRDELRTSLKKLQGDDAYLEELARVDQGEEMNRVLQNLLTEMKKTSDNLKILVFGVPGV